MVTKEPYVNALLLTSIHDRLDVLREQIPNSNRMESYSSVIARLLDFYETSLGDSNVEPVQTQRDGKD